MYWIMVYLCRRLHIIHSVNVWSILERGRIFFVLDREDLCDAYITFVYLTTDILTYIICTCVVPSQFTNLLLNKLNNISLVYQCGYLCLSLYMSLSLSSLTEYQSTWWALSCLKACTSLYHSFIAYF